MKIYDEYMSNVQKKLVKWAVPIIQSEFSLIGSVGNMPGSPNAIRFTIYEDYNKLREFCDKLNVFPTINVYVWFADFDCSEPAGIVIEPTPFWNLNFEPKTFHFIRRMACKNKIPFDVKLARIIPYELDVEYEKSVSEDGFGIEASYANHEIHFTVEAVGYTDCLGDSDIEGFEYCPAPYIWAYSGRWDERYIEGLASSSTLAIGKMLSTIYKDAEKHDKEVAQALKANIFSFHMFGYCH